MIVSDNGTEFTSNATLAWQEEWQIGWHYIAPGKPTQNAFIESFSGFFCPGGTRYLESHHIIALANEGADRMSNVIALCPDEHREAHFGRRRKALEKEMMRKIKSLDMKS